MASIIAGCFKFERGGCIEKENYYNSHNDYACGCSMGGN